MQSSHDSGSAFRVKRPQGQLDTGKIIKNAALAYPERPIIDGTLNQVRTFREVDERVNRLANGLLASGLAVGDVVACMTRVGIETLEVYFACVKAGLAVLPLSYRLHPREVTTILEFVGARGIIFNEQFLSSVNQIECSLNKFVIGEPSGECIGYESLLQADPGEPEIVIEDDFPGVVGTTSGTTGTPKCYIRSQYGCFMTHMLYALNFDLGPGDTALTAIPPLTGLGWVCGVLLGRGTPILMDFDPRKVLENIEAYKVTMVYGVPAMFQAMLAVPDIESYDLSSLRGVASVGSTLSGAVLEKIWKTMTPNVYDQYGLQEIGFVSINKPDKKREKPDSVGAPAPVSDVGIVDEKGRRQGAGEIGRIVVRNPEGAGEYWKNPEKTAESFQEGWFYTGDLGKLDDSGYLYIVGREKDMIVTGGYNVYATDVEDVLLAHEGVVECAVIGLPDERWGERVAAVVKAGEGADISEQELVEYCKERMASYRAPKSVFFVDAFPMTLSGKYMKYKLVEQFRDR